MTAQRRREVRYTRKVTARVSDPIADRLEALADREGVSLAIIVRRVLEAGVAQVERGGDGKLHETMTDARAWWAQLPQEQRTKWQKRLPGLQGREMLAKARAEAERERTQGQ